MTEMQRETPAYLLMSGMPTHKLSTHDQALSKIHNRLNGYPNFSESYPVRHESKSDKVTGFVRRNQDRISPFEMGLAKVPSDLDYSLNRYLLHGREDAAPVGILAKQSAKRDDVPWTNEQPSGHGIEKGKSTGLLDHIGAWANDAYGYVVRT